MAMKRAFLICMAILVAAASVQAQDAQKILDTFRRNFAIGSLDVKIQILQDAAADKTAPSLGPLFQQAVDFVIDNANLIPTDPRLSQLASIGAEQIGVIKFPAARFSVWKLFQATKDSQTLAKAATTLGVVGAGDAEIVADMNHYLDAQNGLFASGMMPDAPVLAATVQAVGKLGDPSSFPILFTALNLGYTDAITAMAKDALLSLKGDFKEMLLGVVKNRPVAEKKLALQMALDSDKLSDDQKGELAEYALDIGLHAGAADAAGKATLRDIRFMAAASLGARKWSHATPFMIEHLDFTIGEFDKGLVDKGRLMDSINQLGAMGTHEAAVRLTQYLVLLNSYTEKSKGYDEGIVLTVLNTLGSLGDKVAFDDLMYTQYLNYSAGVKKAARGSLDKLKW
jgi:hypothetical protein